MIPQNFRAFSARIGQDPLQIQGPGGNTSFKDGNVMWIKASGKELGEAQTSDVFVALDRAAAVAEANGAGDGTCRATVLDPAITQRPSIEATFHAALDWKVVAHTHSVATLAHVTSPQGLRAAAKALEDLAPVFVPYAKPGLPLTTAILQRITPETRLILLGNHGLICCGDTVQQADDLMQTVERALARAPSQTALRSPSTAPAKGFHWAMEESWIAQDTRVSQLVLAGTYYPDHVVFLGRGLPIEDTDAKPPAILVPGQGILVRDTATATQCAMLRCLSDVFRRIDAGWTPTPIGILAEDALMDWDAEKYRKSMAKG